MTNSVKSFNIIDMAKVFPDIRAVAWEELVDDEGGTVWVCQCLDYDIGAQGNTRAEMEKRLVLTLQNEYAFRGSDGVFKGLGAAPEVYFAAWEAANYEINKGRLFWDSSYIPEVDWQTETTTIKPFTDEEAKEVLMDFIKLVMERPNDPRFSVTRVKDD